MNAFSKWYAWIKALPAAWLAVVIGFFSNWYARFTAQPVILLFVITFLIVAFLNPQKIGLALWGISKLALFAFAGDWIDGRIFRNAQPHELTGIEQGTAWKRKGLIVAAAIVAGALVP